MKILIQSKDDVVLLENGKIKALSNQEEYSFDISEVEKILILTTDRGPFYDDMCLIVGMNGETEILVMSEHPSYTSFVFEQLGKVLTLDYETIIKASTSIENNVFVIFTKYRELSVTQIQAVNQDSIVFTNGEKIIFADCAGNRYSEHCIAERDITAVPPYFEFFTDGKPTRLLFDKKGIFAKNQNRKQFVKLQLHIIHSGYSTFDLS